MASTSSKSLYVDGNNTFKVIEGMSTYEPGADELLIETIFSGVNPADIKHATHLGICSTVLGYDFCGRLLRAPRNSKFVPGDIVAGYTPTGIGRPSRYGTHQRYLCCPENLAWKVPDNVPQDHAACLTCVAMTAADVVFNLFGFPLPSEKNVGGVKKPGPMLIWGTSASVGFCTLQLARAVGAHPIFVTASPGRHERLKELGATACFDYASPSVVADVRAAVKEANCGPIRYALDAVGSLDPPSSAELMTKCVDEDCDLKLVSTVIQQDRKFTMPLALKDGDVRIRPLGSPTIVTIPGQPQEARRMWEILKWTLEHYGKDFTLPEVKKLNGNAEKALEEIKKIADGGGGFGKFVVEHPIR
ncbi:GroES-like protein [Zopfia rhizophila CBS 207.26]|uniref:GroES-like protein n=1 Tax=Zopfia rhizophila CBS 207.26 TaxID=1314779 RepID=A0A6A6E997_9PEZI|nr:GroES-like protein [Zopfia rhizophila CBS 207.26]